MDRGKIANSLLRSSVICLRCGGIFSSIEGFGIIFYFLLSILIKICCFCLNSGLELHIVMVRKKPEDQKVISQLAQVKQLVEKTNFSAKFILLEGHPEQGIAEYESKNDISMLLMGAYGHSRIRHFVIGSTTAQILRSSNIPVLVFR
jgi:nucleotide-binding universal stress UspA family protein